VPTLRTVLLAALTAGLFFTPSAAEARFGKRSSSSSEDKNDKEERRERKHAATPVGQQPDRDSSSDDDDDDDSYRPPPRPYRETYVYVAPPPPVHSYRPTVERVERTEEHSPLMLRMGLLTTTMGGGGAVGLHLAFEGRKFGLSSRFNALVLPTDDGTEGTDGIQLTDVHVTWAPWATKQGRFRLEAGVAVASAPDVTFVGPSLGASFEKCLLGPLDVEGKLHIVPVPHRQADLQGGLALHLGILSLRGGWRALVLDDAGLLDGEVHRDVLTGPYAGVGLNF
jgi:hypothetical protein